MVPGAALTATHPIGLFAGGNFADAASTLARAGADGTSLGPVRDVTIDDVIAHVRGQLGVEVARNPATGVFEPPYIAVPPHKVVEFLTSQIRTPAILADALNPEGLFCKVIHGLAQHPLVVHILSDHPAERLNFTSWMGVQTIRSHQYEDPIIADLYLLHELYHMWTMPHEVTQFNDWVTKMTGNEKIAALVSEAFVYFAIPGLRAQAPFKRIWVDRYLNNEELLAPGIKNEELYRTDPNRFFSLLRRKFEGIKYIPRPLMDAEQRRSAAYDESNDLWAEIWREKGLEVEAHMDLVNRVARESPSDAMHMHFGWLNEHATNGVLFLDQAQAFLDAYERIKERLDSDAGAQAHADLAELLRGHARVLDEARQRGEVTASPILAATQQLIAFGATPTVYALPLLETEAAFLEFLRTVTYQELYAYPFLRRQDTVHVGFIDAYRRWASPIVTGLETYPYPYAANGSSEAIKDAITHLLAVSNPAAALHVFQGEYEGAVMFAKNVKVDVREHRRDAPLDEWFAGTKPGDYWYLSQPSSLDGNVWADYDRFLAAAAERGIRVMVDLCYVGCVPNEFHVDVSHPHIDAVFFSLSKSWGTYYMRMGGVFSRQEVPQEWPNLWFKNVLSQRFATHLLGRYGVHDIPRRYQALQAEAIAHLNQGMSALSPEGRVVQFRPSDVILLGHQEILGGPDQLEQPLRNLYRGGAEQGFLRACLTAYMETKLRAERGLPDRPLAEAALWRG